jgi:hypothetical protein
VKPCRYRRRRGVPASPCPAVSCGAPGAPGCSQRVHAAGWWRRGGGEGGGPPSAAAGGVRADGERQARARGAAATVHARSPHDQDRTGQLWTTCVWVWFWDSNQEPLYKGVVQNTRVLVTLSTEVLRHECHTANENINP